MFLLALFPSHLENWSGPASYPFSQPALGEWRGWRGNLRQGPPFCSGHFGALADTLPVHSEVLCLQISEQCRSQAARMASPGRTGLALLQSTELLSQGGPATYSLIVLGGKGQGLGGATAASSFFLPRCWRPPCLGRLGLVSDPSQAGPWGYQLKRGGKRKKMLGEWGGWGFRIQGQRRVAAPLVLLRH